MFLEKVPVRNGFLYNVDIADEKTRAYLESLGVDLVSVAKSEIQKQMLKLEEQRLKKIFDGYGYIDLADVQYYASQNDPEAQALLSWYQAYDDGIWNWIDNTLPSLKTLDEIMQFDIKSVEEEIFNQSLQASPLP